MRERKPTFWTDERILTALDMRDGDGKSASEIGGYFGVSKNAILGLLHRMNKAELPCGCTKPANKNGGMGRGWWKHG